MTNQKHKLLDFPSAMLARSLQSLHAHSGRVKQQPELIFQLSLQAGKGYAAGETFK